MATVDELRVVSEAWGLMKASNVVAAETIKMLNSQITIAEFGLHLSRLLEKMSDAHQATDTQSPAA